MAKTTNINFMVRSFVRGLGEISHFKALERAAIFVGGPLTIRFGLALQSRGIHQAAAGGSPALIHDSKSSSQASTTAAINSASATSFASSAAAHSESVRLVFMAFSFRHVLRVCARVRSSN